MRTLRPLSSNVHNIRRHYIYWWRWQIAPIQVIRVFDRKSCFHRFWSFCSRTIGEVSPTGVGDNEDAISSLDWHCFITFYLQNVLPLALLYCARCYSGYGLGQWEEALHMQRLLSLTETIPRMTLVSCGYCKSMLFPLCWHFVMAAVDSCKNIKNICALCDIKPVSNSIL